MESFAKFVPRSASICSGPCELQELHQGIAHTSLASMPWSSCSQAVSIQHVAYLSWARESCWTWTWQGAISELGGNQTAITSDKIESDTEFEWAIRFGMVLVDLEWNDLQALASMRVDKLSSVDKRSCGTNFFPRYDQCDSCLSGTTACTQAIAREVHAQ